LKSSVIAPSSTAISPLKDLRRHAPSLPPDTQREVQMLPYRWICRQLNTCNTWLDSVSSGIPV